MIEALLIALLVAVVVVGMRIAKGVERIDHSIGSLHQFLFVRLPNLPPEAVAELATNLVSTADLQALSTGKFVIGSHFHPVRKLVDECIRDAYRSAEEVLLTSGPFDQMPLEKQDEINDYFWFALPGRLRFALGSAGCLSAPSVPTAQAREETTEKRVGDVIIEETPGMTPERTFVKPFRVCVMTNDGPKPEGGNLYTRNGAERRALRLVGKGGRVLTRLGGGKWRVDVENA